MLTRRSKPKPSIYTVLGCSSVSAGGGYDLRKVVHTRAHRKMRLKYRRFHNALAPRRPKLAVPGWSGEATRDLPQPWHCKPFVDAATQGIEIYFNWKTECRVSMRRGRPVWSGNLDAEIPKDAPESWQPFSAFAPGYFSMSSMLDIEAPEGMGLLILPHSRFFTDTTGTAPCAVPGLIESDWWPRIFFIVFKAPTPGRPVIFRHGDPIAQILAVPRNTDYQPVEMNPDEQRERAQRSAKLAENWMQYSDQVVISADGYPYFNNKYKILSAIARKGGAERAIQAIDDPNHLPYFGKELTVFDRRSANSPLLEVGKDQIKPNDEG